MNELEEKIAKEILRSASYVTSSRGELIEQYERLIRAASLRCEMERKAQKRCAKQTNQMAEK